jgi:hypothetical protein
MHFYFAFSKYQHEMTKVVNPFKNLVIAYSPITYYYYSNLLISKATKINIFTNHYSFSSSQFVQGL